MSLTQDGASLRGDITLGPCLIGVVGSATPPSGMRLSFALVRGLCPAGYPLPLPSSFSGAGNAALENFAGTLEGAGPLVIARCQTTSPHHAPCR